MKSRETTLASLEGLLELKPGRLTAETKLAEIESWDSMAALALIVWLEEDYGRTVSGKEIRGLQTVGDILAMTEK
jgi:acyl carrier protein